MAIAPLMEYEGLPDGTCGLLERPWPRAVLRVVPAASPVPGRADEDDEEVPGHAAAARRAVQPRARRIESSGATARRSAAVRRRRRILLATLVAGLVALLALPFAALGGAALPPRGLGAAATAATVYVVQPGDTLWSIASRFDRGGNPRPLAEAIAKETGSAAVVPGERIAIP